MKRLILGLVIGMLIGSAATAFAASDTVTATITKLRYIVNGEERDVQTEQLVVMGTTYLPVREVANMLGYDVVYRSDSKTVEFYTAQPMQSHIQPKGEDRNVPIVEKTTLISGRELVDLLGRKYPELWDTIRLTNSGELKLGESIYQLPVVDEGNQRLVDVRPLIDAGIIDASDIQ